MNVNARLSVNPAESITITVVNPSDGIKVNMTVSVTLSIIVSLNLYLSSISRN